MVVAASIIAISLGDHCSLLVREVCVLLPCSSKDLGVLPWLCFTFNLLSYGKPLEWVGC